MNVIVGCYILKKLIKDDKTKDFIEQLIRYENDEARIKVNISKFPEDLLEKFNKVLLKEPKKIR